MLGVLYTLIAATTFAINNASVRRGVMTGTVTQVVAVSMPVGLILFVAVALVSGQLAQIDQLSPTSMALLASAGVVHFVLGRYCGYRSIQAMGANLSAPVQQWSLLVTLSLAVYFLGETLDVLKISGIALMVLGPAIAARAQRARVLSRVATTTTKFKPKLAEGYFFGILCCICWGSSPILVRAGLSGTGLALAGGVVAYGAATLAVLLILFFPVARKDASGIRAENFKWLVWIGVTVCVSQVFMYMAMAIAPVTMVQPLMRLSNVLVIVFSWFMNREYEIFDPGVIVAIGISMIGAVALGADTTWVIQVLEPGEGLARVLAWKWPG